MRMTRTGRSKGVNPLARNEFAFKSACFAALVMLCLSIATIGRAAAQNPTPAELDPALEARVKALSVELRCLVCQNQTVADSDAPVARDMRAQVRAQLSAGKSDAEVKQYMTERFGDFVLYKPPLKASTVVLWIAPFALLALAVVLLAARLRRRQRASIPVALDLASRERARKLLDE